MVTVTGWDKADVVLSGIAALGTLLAVGALVWIEVVRPRRGAPRLRLHEHADLAVTQPLYEASPGGSLVPGARHLMVRLLVENVEGKLPAEDAQVFLREYEPAMPVPGTLPARSGVERLRIPLRWTHATDGPNTVALHGGHPRYVDLVAVSAIDAQMLRLQLEPMPVSGEANLFVPTPGQGRTCRLTLDLVAKGAKPVSYLVDLVYDGVWEGKEPEANLRVEIPPAPE